MTASSPSPDGGEVIETRLSRVDGLAGELVIGGYRVEELAPQATFEEVAFLLWQGRLPDAGELESLHSRLAAARVLPEASLELLGRAAASRMPVMDALRLGVDSLGLTLTADSADEALAARLVAATPALVGAYWRLLQGEAPVVAPADLSHAAAYLFQIFGSAPRPEAARGLETYLNTVVDHGLNASTYTARVIASTRSDMVSAVVGALGALKGPLHGGAPGPAFDMVFDIIEKSNDSGRPLADEAEAWVRQAVAAGERIMGFGHRVYKVRDPRADVLGAAAERLYRGSDRQEFYRQAQTIEDVAVRVLGEMKPGRNLKTNVEFYTALLLHGVGLPTELFTPTFGVARVAGWTAHILEQMKFGRLIRPLEKYVGEGGRRWVPLAGR
jgi:citrate synthase